MPIGIRRMFEMGGRFGVMPGKELSIGPIVGSLIASGIGAGAEWLFGQDPESMSPEQRRALEYVWAELKKGDASMGFSGAEKMGMQKNLKTSLRDYSQKQIGSSTESLRRRGMMSPGQIAGMTTDIMSNAGTAYGQGVNDINLASMKAGRQRKGQLLGMLPGLSQGIPDQGGGTGVGDYMGQLAYYLASRKKKPGNSQGSPMGDYQGYGNYYG